MNIFLIELVNIIISIYPLRTLVILMNGLIIVKNIRAGGCPSLLVTMTVLVIDDTVHRTLAVTAISPILGIFYQSMGRPTVGLSAGRTFNPARHVSGWWTCACTSAVVCWTASGSRTGAGLHAGGRTRRTPS